MCLPFLSVTSWRVSPVVERHIVSSVVERHIICLLLLSVISCVSCCWASQHVFC